MSRVYNFSAGPAVLPEEVLKEAADEMLDYRGTGMSVMEMSHRSKAFETIINEAEADLIGLILMATAYILLCIRYRKRIRELQPGEHPGWNWWKLRRQITELEYQKAEGIVEDIRKAAEGYMTV